MAKVIYLPYMCDHALAMAAAMRYHNLNALVMEPPDAESMSIGKSLCLGKECLPCFTCIGDIVKVSQRPDFDPQQSLLFMPTTGGPCRFGQYRTLLRTLLDERDLSALEIISPSADNSYHGFGEHPTKLRLLIWQATVGVDLLQKLLHEHRPYERVAGQADRVYWACMDELVKALENDGGKGAVAAMHSAAEQFSALAIERQTRRPIIGMVGEIYLRANTFTNQAIVRQMEALGVEVWVATLMEWFYFTNYGASMRAKVARRYADWLKVSLGDLIQQRLELSMLKPVAALLLNGHETPVPEVVKNDIPYYDPLLGTEAALSIGKAIDFAKIGVSGIVSVLPFTCMPGTIVAGLADNIRADHNHIPWLDIMYDDQESTNINTRLEAFVYQARQYQLRMRGA